MGPLALLLPPDIWEEPEVVAAIEAGDLGRFLLAARGARRPRLTQDRAARLIGYGQGTISRIESGKGAATPREHERQVDAVLTGLHVPGELRRRWGGE